MPKIQLRHDTSTNWTTYNPVLLDGEVGIETDTNKMKIGDGTTTYNSLDYFGGDIDLSDYYDKTEVNGLLNEKQDKLSLNPPLTITEYTKSNLEGLTYTMDGTGLLSAGVSDSSKGNRTIVYIPGNDVGFRTICSASTFDSSLSDYEKTWSAGYIDIPYQFGQVVGGGKTSYSLGWGDTNVAFGKFENDEFIPILLMRCSSYPILYISKVDNAFNYSYYSGNNDLTCLMYSADYWAYSGLNARSSISPDIESQRAYGSLYQLIDTGSTIKANYGYANVFGAINGADLYNHASISSEAYTRLKEITTARIIPLQNKGGQSSYPLLIDGVGLYNYEGEITASTFTTENALGENLFDISGVTKQTYLDLHIGTGLSVDGNGNLVNTNPTPADLSNYIQKTDVAYPTIYGNKTPVTVNSSTGVIRINPVGNLSTPTYFPDVDAQNGIIVVPTTERGNIILDKNQVLGYYGTIVDTNITFPNQFIHDNDALTYVIIGHLDDSTGSFTPGLVCTNDNLYSFAMTQAGRMVSNGVTCTTYIGNFSPVTSTTSSSEQTHNTIEIREGSNNTLDITVVLKQASGSPSEELVYNINDVSYNCVIFGLSTLNNKYFYEDFTITDTNNTVIWKPTSTNAQSYLNISIGSGLTVSNSGQLVVSSDRVIGTGITNITKLTQAEYDALATKDANTFYVIVPASNS